MIRSCFSDFLHIFYPKVCVCCTDALITSEKFLCFICESKLPLSNTLYYNDEDLEKLFWGRCDISHATSLYRFYKNSPVQKMIHEIKYKNNLDLAEFLAIKLAKQIKNSNKFEHIDGIMPIPMHPSKEIKRGYNQSEVIASTVSKHLGVTLFKRQVKRIDINNSQTTKSRLERWQNIKNSFLLKHPDDLRGKNIIVIDDVITTGSTIDALVTCLKQTVKIKTSIAALAFTPSSNII